MKSSQTLIELAEFLDPNFQAKRNYSNKREVLAPIVAQILQRQGSKYNRKKKKHSKTKQTLVGAPTRSVDAPAQFVHDDLDSASDDGGDDDDVCQKEVREFKTLAIKARRAQAEELDPLKFWHEHGNKLPNLAKLARAILACPASSAACERVFSAAGRLLDTDRNQLSPHNFCQILFLNQYRKSF